ncbi:MAG: Ig-like domain-containing protein [Pseudomonadota bacterium]
MALSWTSEQDAALDEPTSSPGATTVRKSSAAAADVVAPVLLSTSPADNASAVAPGANLLLTFSEVVQAGSGTIVIYNVDGSLARAIPVGDASQVSFSGTAVTINPSIDLAAGRSYFVTFSAGVFQDVSGNAHAGISASSAFNFTTASPAGDDFPFSVDTTGVVLVGSPGTVGSIDTVDDVDLMKVTLVAGTKYTFTLNSSASTGLSDPYLSLYGANMALLASDDDSGGMGNASISFTATSSGLYYLGAADFSSGTGGYVLSAALSQDAADDYAASPQTSASLSIGGSMTGAINFSADRDWIKVNLVAGVSYDFQLRGADGFGGTLGLDFAEAYLQLFDANGALLRGAADGGTGGDPRVSFIATSSGSYYLGVSDLYDGSMGSYTLSASLGNDDAGDDAGTLARLTMGASTGGTIGSTGDDDWFGVTLKQGFSYRFELSTSNSGGGTLGSGDAEGYLKLFDIDGLLDYAFEGAAGADPVLLFTAARSGLHFLSVSELLGLGTGSYTLKAIALTFEDDYSANAATTGSVAIGGQASGTIEQAGDNDWFGVDLVANTAYVFDLKGADGGGGTLGAGAAEAYLILYGPTGLSQQAASGGGAGGDPQITFTPTVSGRYFLSASDVFGAGSGSYTIVAARVGAPDLTAPALFSASPADASSGAAVGASIVFTFNEAVTRGSGSIALRKADGTLVELFDAASNPSLIFSGNTLTIKPSAQLAHNTSYTLDLNAGTLRDLAGNSFAGHTGYDFRTETLPNTSPSGSVSITGPAIQGQTLNAVSTLADADGLGAFSYQWLAQGNPISGATGASFQLAQEQVGQNISVVISYIDAQGHAEAVSSQASAAVANVNDAPVGALSISGTLMQGRQLEALNPTLRDADGLGVLKYQWLANGVAIAGATSAQLTLLQAHVGKSISVIQSYTDGYGATEQFTSPASAVVANVNELGEVFISNTLSPGLLAGVVLDTDGFGNVAYQWQSSADGSSWSNIANATGMMFRSEGATLNLQLRVLASYTDSYGSVEQAVSVPLGQAADDRLIGSAASDAIFGGEGNDRITGGAGNDVIDGGTGIDSAQYAGARARYSITHTTSGVLVADSTGSEGLDTLSGVERLLFGNEGFALDTGAGAIGGQAYRLYQAAFDRTPDLGGVGFWMNAMDRGSSLIAVAAGFVASDEYKALYPANLSNAELVGRYYLNILGRPAEQGGLDFWTGVLDKKLSTVPEVLAAISESAENVALTASVIGAGFPYTPFG